MNIDQIINDRDALFTSGNNDGDGYDPEADIQGLLPVHTAETTDDVSVYLLGDRAVLVGTDGSGSDDSRWGVTVAMDE